MHSAPGGTFITSVTDMHALRQSLLLSFNTFPSAPRFVWSVPQMMIACTQMYCAYSKDASNIIHHQSSR